MFLHAFHHRELNPKICAHRRAPFSNRSTHRLGQTLGKCEAKTSALDFAVLRAEPIEWRKQTSAFVRRNAGTFIAHRNPETLTGLWCKIDNHPTGLAIVLHGVGQDVE